MDYTKIYWQLITKAIKRKASINSKSMLEKHHIIPRCAGGRDVDWNLICLTSREHIIAHLLLEHIDKEKYPYLRLTKKTKIRKFSSRKNARLREINLISSYLVGTVKDETGVELASTKLHKLATRMHDYMHVVNQHN